MSALADVVDAAQQHPAVTTVTVTVIRRDGQALLRQESRGRQAAWALAAERTRPYTAQEAVAFLRLRQALCRALPQHRQKREEIAALARPLMPAQVQQARIDWPHPHPWPLPVQRLPLGYGSLSSFSQAA
ncbi:hypothetical protein [Streptomyces sp. NPDC017940]|uniref:hypothetical protein n=1 Tax=Streptomyces sp. NPDC017940 TaxID=3365017 RepID=UPI0037ACBFED